MKKFLNKENNSIILMISSSVLLVILLMITTFLKVGSDTKLFEKEATIYTSAKEYTPTKIVNVYNVTEEKPEEEEKEESEEIIEEEIKPEIQVEQKEEPKKEPEIVEKSVVYDNMTIEELSDKLNKSLNSNVSGYGNLFASYSLEKGVDPYIAVAIMLHETGCSWNCSNLVKSCNNVGGQKGSPSCGGGSYKYYATLEEGIRGYIDNLSQNYFAQGLTTPETIARKYTGHEGATWVSKVNYYIEDIKVK